MKLESPQSDIGRGSYDQNTESSRTENSGQKFTFLIRFNLLWKRVLHTVLTPKMSQNASIEPHTLFSHPWHKKLHEELKSLATNNEAEYEAVIIALELAKNLELEHVKVFSDSQQVVGQIEGSFERKDKKMSLYCLKVHDLQRQFVSCKILKVARADNIESDALSRLIFMGVDGLDRTVHIKIVAEPSIAQKPSVMDIDHEPSWMDPIVDYISNDNLPLNPLVARSIRYRATRYCLIKGVLFRRSLTLPYLRCLKPSESLQALTEVHEGVCENHQKARAFVYKLIRYGYYWPSMKKDAADYVQKCDKCQKFGNIRHVPTEELTSIHYSSSFEQWGVDILRPFPLARGQLKFGIPKVLITDNGRKFDNPQFRSFCANHGIDHRLTLVSHPQRDVKGDWPDELPSILWTHKTSYKTTTGETPFMLAFGLEVTIPIEVNLPTIRKLETNMEEQTTEHVDLLEEVREQASLRASSYQSRIARHFNNKVLTRRFRVADLVLRKAKAAEHPPGKLGPIWEGPFEVIRKLKDGTYSLRDTSGKPLLRPWNADNLKFYYN
ncbi:uncharacterized protein LOC111369265 [Olea europaea var. sylvestris]|uniref:uncharacterized protein LOC111369265 n=1 Tax=Olea europaea var. sylvestris TaxID=158386 RepID=UPI000C1D0B6D|nr:uncharacterized protein LOC111369265 [Olea europaea var. sylvestris]